jgi:hypothetical protein
VHCEHEHDDGAYVLGALSPAERMAYERHLATCSFCREAVADISALPDLLSRLDAQEFAKLLDPTLTAGDPARSAGHPGAAMRDLAIATGEYPRVGRRKHTGKAKAFRVRVLSSAAAVIFVLLIGVAVVSWTSDNGAPAAPPLGPAVAMAPVEGSSPITATLRLTSTAGGTHVDMTCLYSKSATRPYTFRLMAYGPDEEKEQIGSWQASPGAEFPMEAVTHFARGSLSRLELVQFDGKALLAYDVP